MVSVLVMLSGMIFTGKSMQIYEDDRRPFASCQLDLETQAMKTSNENLLSWQACERTDMHTCTHADIDTDTQIIHSPAESFDKCQFHMLKVKNEITVMNIHLGTPQLLWQRSSHQYEALHTYFRLINLQVLYRGIYARAH